MRDLRVLPRDLVKDLWTLGGVNLQEYMCTLIRIPEGVLETVISFFNPKGRFTSLRRLNIKWDFEAKPRIIAMFDYWSQTALKPLHDSLMKSLRGISTDRTYRQDDVRSLFACPGPYHRFDLSQATDRFPLSVQTMFLEMLIGEEKSKAWSRILTHWRFTPSWKPDTAVKYGAGQPIGAYSSWAVFALCHHLVVQYAAMRVNKYPFYNYCLLGDDIVIAGSEVGQSYKEVIMQLGVSISESKTHVSDDTFELAKKWYHRGAQITPFPLNRALESNGDYVSLAETIADAYRKGLTPRRDGYEINLSDPGFGTSLFLAFDRHPAFAAKLAYKLGLVLIYPSGPTLVWKGAKAIFRMADVSIPCAWRVATVVRIFERVAAQTKVKDISKEVVRLLTSRQK